MKINELKTLLTVPEMFEGSSWCFLRKEHTEACLHVGGCFLLLTTPACCVAQVASTNTLHSLGSRQ